MLQALVVVLAQLRTSKSKTLWMEDEAQVDSWPFSPYI